MTKLYASASVAFVCALVVAAYMLWIFGRPPMPVSLGTVLWDDETGFSVSKVARHPVSAAYGERYAWTLHSAHVFDNNGRTYAANAGSAAHRILGAMDTEHLTFLLPANVEQPAIVFDDTLRWSSIAGALRAGHPELYEPHRFNLRYD